MLSEMKSLLEILPEVEFCCIYGSTLHPNNRDKTTSMIDYIIGVKDPLQWHKSNLIMNKNHYASWLVHFGGASLIRGVSDNIGVGVHFNPFVSYNDRLYKYGVVRMDDLVDDIVGWERFYLSGRLHKPVNVIVDKMNVKGLNSVNLKAVTAAALLLLPLKFSEEDLYAKICSLSYTGDLRMIFAEDRNKVKKIVTGQFELFQEMYKPVLEEFAEQDLCRFLPSVGQGVNINQDSGSSTTSSLVSFLPMPIKNQMQMQIGRANVAHNTDQSMRKILIKSKSGTGECLQRILRRKVMVSSARQAVAGFLTVGAVHGLRYLGNKMSKAWRS